MEQSGFKVYSWDDVLYARIAEAKNGTALTIGSFDGPHRGHQVLFAAVLNEKAYTPGVVTFAVPPPALKEPARFPGLLSTLPERLAFFKESRFAFAAVIDFSLEFSKMAGEVFLSCLQKNCNMRFLAEGKGFRCGFRGETDMVKIRRIAQRAGFRVLTAEPVLYGGEPISSSRIRLAIETGKLTDASEMLGRPASSALKRVGWH
ncbi:FAD synthetase family protein [Treponema endosymbiont of Eucomonympha sp.]|uniref:FAD synthetase family protein n=1 Tax=Treponema endosymbiont of Eucomonympha sp. TaxID=1580831 RepID=UPI00075171FD|nr:FAD synthetase family protein [Treponema endosymbiont of Eucomonympha sp.]